MHAENLCYTVEDILLSSFWEFCGMNIWKCYFLQHHNFFYGKSVKWKFWNLHWRLTKRSVVYTGLQKTSTKCKGISRHTDEQMPLTNPSTSIALQFPSKCCWPHVHASAKKKVQLYSMSARVYQVNCTQLLKKHPSSSPFEHTSLIHFRCLNTESLPKTSWTVYVWPIIQYQRNFIKIWALINDVLPSEPNPLAP